MFRFPVDNQFLTIDIQDKQLGMDQLAYVPDTESSKIGAEVNIPGYTIEILNNTNENGLRMVQKPYFYNTTMGDPSMNDTVFSQLRTGIFVTREDLTVLSISLIGIFIAVFAGLMSLLILSYQGRFSWKEVLCLLV